jgi:integrase
VDKGFNPAADIELFREKARERFLTTVELERLGNALREAETEGIPWMLDPDKATAKHAPKSATRTVFSPYAVAAIRLLLLTGARLREILHAKWDDVDLERGVLLLPDSKTGRSYRVLSAATLSDQKSAPVWAVYHRWEFPRQAAFGPQPPLDGDIQTSWT